MWGEGPTLEDQVVAILIIQVRCDDAWFWEEEGRGCEMVRMGYILKIKQMEFVLGLDAGCET